MKKIFIIGAIALLSLFSASNLQAQDDFIGEIRMFAGTYAPRGWAFCQGQLISIRTNTPLFAILGTQYGGDGITTFALPDLQGRVPIGVGQGPGLSSYDQGEIGGVETVTLNSAQMPVHTHSIIATMGCYDGPGNVDSPVGNYAAKINVRGYEYSNLANAVMAPFTWSVGTAGGSQPHENHQKSYGINYIICVSGGFPSRW